MIQIHNEGVFYRGGTLIPAAQCADSVAEGRKKTIAYGILSAHNTSGNMDALRLKFDAMASHDITYVGIIQTARASGLEKFPLPQSLP